MLTLITVGVSLGISSWLGYQAGASVMEQYQAAAAAATPPDPAAFATAAQACVDHATVTQAALRHYPILHPQGAQLKQDVLNAYANLQATLPGTPPGAPHGGAAAVDAATALADWLAQNPNPAYARAALPAQHAATAITKAVTGMDRAAGVPAPDFPWVDLLGAWGPALVATVGTVGVVVIGGVWVWRVLNPPVTSTPAPTFTPPPTPTAPTPTPTPTPTPPPLNEPLPPPADASLELALLPEYLVLLMVVGGVAWTAFRRYRVN